MLCEYTMAKLCLCMAWLPIAPNHATANIYIYILLHKQQTCISTFQIYHGSLLGPLTLRLVGEVIEPARATACTNSLLKALEQKAVTLSSLTKRKSCDPILLNQRWTWGSWKNIWWEEPWLMTCSFLITVYIALKVLVCCKECSEWNFSFEKPHSLPASIHSSSPKDFENLPRKKQLLQVHTRIRHGFSKVARDHHHCSGVECQLFRHCFFVVSWIVGEELGEVYDIFSQHLPPKPTPCPPLFRASIVPADSATNSLQLRSPGSTASGLWAWPHPLWSAGKPGLILSHRIRTDFKWGDCF